MNILLVHNYYKKKNVGGEDVVFRNELAELKRNSSRNKIFEYTVTNDDFKIFRFLFNFIYNKNDCTNIKNIIENERIDIVHFHNFFPILTASVFKAAKRAGARTVLTLHNYRLWCISGLLYRSNKGICKECFNKGAIFGIIHKCYRNSYFQSIIATVAFYCYRKLKYFDYIDKFFVLTNQQRENVVNFGISESKVSIKPNLVSFNDYTKDNKASGYLFVGRLDDGKGVKILIDTWETLDNEFQLYIIGNGPLKDYIEERASDNIHYLGVKSHEEVLQLISTTKYVIQTSVIYETFGLTIIEAFSMGVPVIGFNIGTRKELIKNGWNGFKCEIYELKETIEKSYYCENYNQLSNNAKKTSETFSSNNIIYKQIKMYEDMIR